MKGMTFIFNHTLALTPR